MIFYGSKATKIGQLDINNSICQHCENTGTQRIAIFGKYAHVYWIPFFPLGKQAVSECVSCKRTIGQKDFPNQLMSRYTEKKSAIKRPIWHWTGLGAIGAIFLFFNLSSALKKVDPRSEFLEADIALMSTTPSESDSIATSIKTILSIASYDGFETDEFEYFTDTTSSKALVLVRVPELSSVDKEGQKTILNLIDKMSSNESWEGKDKYIGLLGRRNVMLCQTPSGTETKSSLSELALLDYYGESKIE